MKKLSELEQALLGLICKACPNLALVQEKVDGQWKHVLVVVLPEGQVLPVGVMLTEAQFVQLKVKTPEEVKLHGKAAKARNPR